jgi:hypothetical protein
MDTPEGFELIPSAAMAAYRRRLDMAERVALMHGWSAHCHDTDREKAAYEVWRDWHDEYGKDAGRRLKPELTDEYIEQLARKRDATRAATLQRMRELGMIPE